MKIFIITAVYSPAGALGDATANLHEQFHAKFKHIVQDAGSKDGVLDLISKASVARARLVSKPDKGSMLSITEF